MTTALPLYVEGIGLLAPGLPDWETALPVLRGDTPHVLAPTELLPPARLPPAERRRAGEVVRLAMNVADAAVAQSGADPSLLPTVFVASGGAGANCHSICEEMTKPEPLMSPTRFTNSVYNAPAGYWHIAVASHASSTSLCALDGSVCAGLLEAATAVHAGGRPVLLVCYDLPYPEPLNSKRPIAENFGVAFVLSHRQTPQSRARLRLRPVPAASTPLASCADASLDALRQGIPAAAALPLLQALARREPAMLTLSCFDDLALRVELDFCQPQTSAPHEGGDALADPYSPCLEKN